MAKQKTRKTTTQVTSVSVSPEFDKFLDQYNLSPTEVFRVGMAVKLSELGVSPYDMSKLNSERRKNAEAFLKIFDETEKLAQISKKIADFELMLREVER